MRTGNMWIYIESHRRIITGTGNANLVIFDGSTPTGREAFSGSAFYGKSEIGSRTRLIFINPGSNLPFMQGETIDSGPTRVIKADAAHPLLADVSLQGLQVRESTYRNLPLFGHSLVETEKGSLIWLGTESG